MDRKRTAQDKIRPGWKTLAVLVSGALAWTLVVIVILVALRDRDGDSLPEGDPIAAQNTPQDALPTLGAVTVTATRETSTVTETAAATETAAVTLTQTAAPTEPPSSTPTRVAPTLPPVPLITLAISAVPPSPGPSPTPTLPPAPTLPPSPTPTPEPTVCPPPPEGWERYSVQAGDTLFAFVLGANQPGLTVDDLLAANCLSSRFLAVGQVLYLPAGAAENAPPSEPYVPPAQAGAPRPGSCPCTLSVAAGWRREQIADMITRSGTTFSGADFLAVTGPGVSTPYEFVNARPAGVSMEGYLFPGTYTVGNETTAEQFRDMLLAAFAGAVSDQMRADAAAQGVTFHQALTIASIVQRETAGAELERLVASVYYNRLRDGTPLGATVTVQYALGAPGAWWPRVRSVNVQSPYNTYQVSGLPPGPICNPGLSAITAAVYPPATNYRFHTASCTGAGEVFAETYEEHLRNVNCGG